MNTSFLFKLSTWGWLLIILYLSLMPQISTPINFNHLDKLLHFGSYGLAAILVILAYPKINHYMPTILLFSFSLMIEIAQLFAVNRYFEMADLVANLAGILLATYLMKLLRPILRS